MSDAHIQSSYDALFKSVEGCTTKMGVLEKLGYYYKYFTYMAGWMLPEQEHQYQTVLNRYKRFNEQRSGQSTESAGNMADSAGLNGRMNSPPW